MIKKYIKFLMIFLLFIVLIVASINAYMILSTKNQLKIDIKDVPKQTYAAGVVLGAGVRDSQPTPILQERLDAAINLYKNGKVPLLIMSGADWGRDYNEVEVMRDYAIAHGIPEDKVLMDHGGYITYDSVMRAKDVYKKSPVIFVTQRYHMPRTLFLANAGGLEAIGFMPTEVQYHMQYKYSSREVLARVKNFFIGLWQPQTYYEGQPSWIDHR